MLHFESIAFNMLAIISFFIFFSLFQYSSISFVFFGSSTYIISPSKTIEPKEGSYFDINSNMNFSASCFFLQERNPLFQCFLWKCCYLHPPFPAQESSSQQLFL